jgi:PBP1b-binding outer membrane lipoprotein LpoB
MRWLLAAFALVLSGCAAEPPAPNSPASAPLSTPAAPVQQLQGIEGEYTVVFVDGAPPVINIPGYAPTITIGRIASTSNRSASMPTGLTS